MESGKKGKGHGHPWMAGIIGIIVSVVLLVKMPDYKVLSGTVMVFALAHLIVGIFLLLSAYMVMPQKIIYKLFRPSKVKQQNGGLYFGWSYGWMNVYWVVSLLLLIASVFVYMLNENLVWLSFILLLFSFQFFVGNINLRASKKLDYMTLPYVELLSSDNDLILDAGCGSGRTSVALGKVMKNSRIVALDRFDSDYIESGGKALLERNLSIAGIADRVEIAQGDITELKFENNYFDAAISTYMMDHLGKYKLPALKEIYRTLKPGSKFLLVVFVPNWLTFSVFNLICFTLTSRKGWRKLFQQSQLQLREEGSINGGIYFLLQKN